MPQRWTPWSPETQPSQVMHTQSARVRVCFMICLCVRVACSAVGTVGLGGTHEQVSIPPPHLLLAQEHCPAKAAASAISPLRMDLRRLEPRPAASRGGRHIQLLPPRPSPRIPCERRIIAIPGGAATMGPCHLCSAGLGSNTCSGRPAAADERAVLPCALHDGLGYEGEDAGRQAQ